MDNEAQITEVKESDRDLFVRLANRRVTKTLKFIRLIGNLSNKSNYSYTDKDVDKIFKTLRKALDECQQRFEGKKKNKEDFNIDEEIET